MAAAIRATTDTTGRPSRKDMEREVASGMLVTRLAESGTHWQRNRYTHVHVHVHVYGEQVVMYTCILYVYQENFG